MTIPTINAIRQEVDNENFEGFLIFLKDKTSIGKGWFPLLLELHSKLSASKHNYIPIVAKQKFGALKFLALGLSDEAWDVIREFEAKSITICEVCGDPGEIRNSGPVKTLCDRHHQEREDKWNEQQSY